ncbi:MAG: hypothetical protein KAS12_00970 [Candidatus Aenigmarchaeota archaeon]|nr:hypothetical protein [Candidatus Aenigmarchaeota archaeon]
MALRNKEKRLIDLVWYLHKIKISFPRGRVATKLVYQRLGISVPSSFNKKQRIPFLKNKYMSFPLYLILIPYAVFVFCLTMIVFFCFYHLLRFGFLTNLTVLASFFLIAIFALLVFISYKYLAPINWKQSIQLMENINPSSIIF